MTATTTTLEVDAVQALFEPCLILSLLNTPLDAVLHVTKRLSNDAVTLLREPESREDFLPLGDPRGQHFQGLFVAPHLVADVLNAVNELRYKNLLTHDTLH